MKLTVVGTGYVGLVAGVCFAETGHEVTCVDIDADKIEKLKRGEVTIYEPGLSDLLVNNYKSGRLQFTTSLTENFEEAEVIFIAVGTPMGEDGSADVKYVLQVAKEIGQNLKAYKVIVDKSTVPVGTADLVKAEIEKSTDVEFDVVSNPEFMKEGAAIQDFMHPDRIVIGCDSQASTEKMLRLYDPFVRTGAPIHQMDVRSAEMTKYVSNAMLATKISFINEMARVCDLVGADIEKVRVAVGSDKRIGRSFLFPGVGYGGSCFPKDVRAIEKTGQEMGLAMHVMSAVTKVNEEQKIYLANKVKQHFNGELKGRKFAVWGLSFKPKTDDMREAPSLVMIDFLLKEGAEVHAYDPQAMQVAQESFYLGDSITYGDDPYSILEGADALILMTEWTMFRSIRYKEIKARMKEPVVFDGRNIYDKAEVLKQGIRYYGIGL